MRDNQDVYNSSKLCININHIQATSGFSWRVCDVMASNGCLVSEDNPGIHRLFPDIPIPVFSNKYEAREQCIRLLKNENLRREIVLQCQAAIEQGYRFKHILPQLENFLNIPLQASAEGAPVSFFNEKIYKKKKNKASISYKLKNRIYKLLYSGGIFISLFPGFNIILKNKRKELIAKYNNLK